MFVTEAEVLTFVPQRICLTATSTLKVAYLVLFSRSGMTREPKGKISLFSVHSDRDLRTLVDNCRNMSCAELFSNYFSYSGS